MKLPDRWFLSQLSHRLSTNISQGEMLIRRDIVLKKRLSARRHAELKFLCQKLNFAVVVVVESGKKCEVVAGTNKRW
jgi:hypothetical protein